MVRSQVTIGDDKAIKGVNKEMLALQTKKGEVKNIQDTILVLGLKNNLISVG